MRVESTEESLNRIEKECEMDRKCHQTAVTFVEGTPACEYHAGVIF